jgi:hypothetical protein
VRSTSPGLKPDFSLQPYTYASGNPVNQIDPTGLRSFWNGCMELALVTGALATNACYLLVPLVNLCIAIGAGTGNLIAYLWDTKKISFSGAHWAFFSAFAVCRDRCCNLRSTAGSSPRLRTNRVCILCCTSYEAR